MNNKTENRAALSVAGKSMIDSMDTCDTLFTGAIALNSDKNFKIVTGVAWNINQAMLFQ